MKTMPRRIGRRTVLAALGCAGTGLLAPFAAFAQARLRTVAVLFAGESDDDEKAAKPFFEEMARHGWVEGKSVAYDLHSGKGIREYLATVASVAAGRAPDLIYATTTSLAAATLKETGNEPGALPIVFATAADPVGAGLVRSLAKPGGNATGVYQVPGDAAGKRYALVREALPQLKRLGSVFDRGAPEYRSRMAAHEKAAKAAGLELAVEEFTNYEAIERILVKYRRAGITAAEITPSFTLIGRRREVASLASINRVALVGHRMEWAEAGALLTYGIDVGEMHKRAAGIAHRVLKGERPSGIAVERPNRFELALNSRSAAELGFTLPRALLQKADKVFT